MGSTMVSPSRDDHSTTAAAKLPPKKRAREPPGSICSRYSRRLSNSGSSSSSACQVEFVRSSATSGARSSRSSAIAFQTGSARSLHSASLASKSRSIFRTCDACGGGRDAHRGPRHPHGARHRQRSDLGRSVQGFGSRRVRQRYEQTRQWHFVNIELDGPNLDRACFGHPRLPAAVPASSSPAKACLVDKIEQFTAELSNSATAPGERLLALEFLLHLVGDVHQPLHAVDDHDAGGNRKQGGRDRIRRRYQGGL